MKNNIANIANKQKGGFVHNWTKYKSHLLQSIKKKIGKTSTKSVKTKFRKTYKNKKIVSE